MIDASPYLLVLPGRLHGVTATDHQSGQRLSVAPCTSYTSARGYNSSLHARDQSNIEFYQSNCASHFRVDPPLLTSHQLSGKFKVINTRRRVRGLHQCCLSSAYSDGNFIPPRKFSNLDFLDGQNNISKHSTVTRTAADFTSEEYEVTGTNLDSILSPDGASEAVLGKEVEQAVPWWKQLPKRWVMVLLCFTAFLLCNMDRVRFFIRYKFC